MKRLILVALAICIVVTINGYSQRVTDYRFPCTKDKTEMFKAIEKIMKEEGLRFNDKKEERNGTMHYSYTTNIICELPTYCYTTIWEYWYDDEDKQIFAIPMQIRGTAVGIYDNDTPESLVSYWNVRAKLEKLCNSKVIITIYKANPSLKSQTYKKLSQ